MATQEVRWHTRIPDWEEPPRARLEDLIAENEVEIPIFSAKLNRISQSGFAKPSGETASWII